MSRRELEKLKKLKPRGYDLADRIIEGIASSGGHYFRSHTFGERLHMMNIVIMELPSVVRRMNSQGHLFGDDVPNEEGIVITAGLLKKAANIISLEAFEYLEQGDYDKSNEYCDLRDELMSLAGLEKGGLSE